MKGLDDINNIDEQNNLKLNYYLRNISDLSESFRNVIKRKEDDDIFLVYVNLLDENMKKVKSILKDCKE